VLAPPPVARLDQPFARCLRRSSAARLATGLRPQPTTTGIALLRIQWLMRRSTADWPQQQKPPWSAPRKPSALLRKRSGWRASGALPRYEAPTARPVLTWQHRWLLLPDRSLACLEHTACWVTESWSRSDRAIEWSRPWLSFHLPL